MAEWQGIYKRYLTEDEKKELIRIANSYKDEKNLDGRLWFAGLSEADKVFIDNLFEEILHDYVEFKNIIFSSSGKIVLQPEKKWSPMFTGVSPIELSDILEDRMIMEKNCTEEELNDHLVSRSRFYNR